MMLLDIARAVPRPAFGEGFDFRLLNEFQRDFPLVSRPFARIAEVLGCSESLVLSRLADWQAGGTVSRVGPVFSPRRVGASTLAALMAPPEHLESIARFVSAHPEVNHNYAREHDWNLWFVVTAPDGVALARVLREIRRDTGCPVMALPLRAEYHIDLGFDLAGGARPVRPAVRGPLRPEPLDAAQLALMAAMQGGVPLISRPFARIAREVGVSEASALATVEDWLARGIVKRFGVVVRHHELGYRANAMCVWTVPDGEVDALGARLAAAEGVNLCYRRKRGGAAWPYNLYCMLHGHDRDEVRARLARIAEDCALAPFPAEVLFSTRRFKQCGARYAVPRHG